MLEYEENGAARIVCKIAEHRVDGRCAQQGKQDRFHQNFSASPSTMPIARPFSQLTGRTSPMLRSGVREIHVQTSTSAAASGTKTALAAAMATKATIPAGPKPRRLCAIFSGSAALASPWPASSTLSAFLECNVLAGRRGHETSELVISFHAAEIGKNYGRLLR